VLEPGVLFAADQVVPDSAEHAEVVRAAQLPFQGLGRRQFPAVAAQDLGEHCHRVQLRCRPTTGRRIGSRQPSLFTV